MKKDGSLRVSFHAPLIEGDTPESTVGCRAFNPDNCKYYELSSKCAFKNKEGICYIPTKAWKKQYQRLKMEGDNNETK